MALFHNTNRIPAGDEMGGILEAFAALILAFLIYVLFATVSIILWNKGTKNKNIIQLILSVLCVGLIYYSSWKVCVYREAPLTAEETEELKIKNTNEFNSFYARIPKLIEHGDVYRPLNGAFVQDSLFILNSLKSLFGQSFHTMDSTSKIKTATFLGYRTGWFFEDSLGVSKLLETANQSLKLRNIFYSPDYQVLLAFVSYKTKFVDIDNKWLNSGEAIALIGYKQNNEMIFYKYYKLDSYINFITNDDIAYSYCFKEAIGKGYNSEIYSNFLKSKFWQSPKVTKSVNYNGKLLYGFEAYLPNYEKPYKLIDPILILSK